MRHWESGRSRRKTGSSGPMKLLGLVWVLGGVLLVGLFAAGDGWSAEQGTLHITSPTKDEVIKGGDVTITWEVKDVPSPNHFHVKVDDGKPMVVHGDSKKFTGISPGKHTVHVEGVDMKHHKLGLEDQVEFSVE